ncbi:MAG: ABC1 kinase family protein [Myxococcota bacterium]
MDTMNVDRSRAGATGNAGAVKPGDLLSASFRASARGEGRASLYAWLAVAHGMIDAIERTAWQMREVADEAMEAFTATQRDLGEMAGTLRAAADEARRWPAKQARMASTGWMLTKVVGSYRWYGIRSAFMSRAGARSALDALHATNARRFYETSVEQGGAFLKVGQMLSARPDLLPAAWIRGLAGLQDDAPAAPFAHVRSVVEAELGGTLEDRFAEFDETPLAAASIGQVHRATTHEGLEVAVKVQRPGIRELVDTDMGLLTVFLESMESMLPPSDYDTIIPELRDMIRGELDYRREAESVACFGRMFEDVPGVGVPRLVEALCGDRVLTTTFVRGRRISEVLEERAASSDPEAHAELSDLLGRLLEAYLRQILAAGRFQADPHPGNFLVTEDGELVLLDFGCTKELPEKVRQGFIGIMHAFMAGDEAGVTTMLEKLGFATRSGRPDTLHLFAERMLQQFRQAATPGEGVKWPTKEEVLEQTADLLDASHADPVVRIPAEFVMVARVFTTLGGLFTHYRPDLNVASRVLPHLFPV